MRNTVSNAGREAFWDRSWKAVEPRRIADYAGSLGMESDPIIDFLKSRGAVRVCDAGCGCGAYTWKLVRHGFDLCGFDVSAEAVRLAGALLAAKGCAAELTVSSVLDPPYPDAAFDAAVARDVIDHLPLRNGIRAVRALRRIVRPGGWVLLTLDAMDEDYAAQPHEVSADGDLLFSGGKWSGMVFHPYTLEELMRLGPDGAVHILSDAGGFTVAVEA